MGAYSGVGAYLSKWVLGEGAYSGGGGLFGSGGLFDHLRYLICISYLVCGMFYTAPSTICVLNKCPIHLLYLLHNTDAVCPIHIILYVHYIPCVLFVSDVKDIQDYI